MHKLIFLFVLFASFVKVLPVQTGMGKIYAASKIEIADDSKTESEKAEESEKLKSAAEDKLGHHWYLHAVINSSRLLKLTDTDEDPFLSYFSQPATPPPNSPIAV